MENSLISVIVPVYNSGIYVDRCIKSLVNQTYKNIEIILVDDGSTDNSGVICDSWAEKDSRVKVIHKTNEGVAKARNVGLANICGRYICFADSDDYLEKNMIEFLLNQLLENNADISVCNYQINDEKIEYYKSEIISPFDALKKICVGNYRYGVVWNKLYKKELFDGVQFENLACCEDMVANYFVFKKANSIVQNDTKLYHYYQNENSIVHGAFNAKFFDAILSKKIIMDLEQGSDLYPYVLKGFITSCFVALSGIVTSKNCADKYESIRHCIVKNRKIIYTSKLYSKRDKIKTFVLTFLPKLYNHLI